MKYWLNNVSLKSKLISIFCVCILSSLILCISMDFILNRMIETNEKLYKHDTANAQLISNCNLYFYKAACNFCLCKSNTRGEEGMDSIYKDLETGINLSIKYFSDYIKNINSDNYYFQIFENKDFEEREKVLSALEEFSVLAHSLVSKKEYDNYVTIDRLGELTDFIVSRLREYYESAIEFGKVNFESSQKYAKSRAIFNTSVNFVVVLLVGIFVIYVIKDIISSINRLKNLSLKISNGDLKVEIRNNRRDELGHLSNAIGDMVDVFKELLFEINRVSQDMVEGNIESKIDENQFKGDYKKVAIAINTTTENLVKDMMDILTVISSYARGDMSISLRKMLGKKEVANKALSELQYNLKSINNEINLLVNAAIEGKLSQRADCTMYNGSWQDIIQNLNSLLEEISKPIVETSEVLSEIEKGNLGVALKGEYRGDFGLLKDMINTTTYLISDYISDISNILHQISSKNLDLTIEKEYKGDFNKIKLSLLNIIDTFNLIISEIDASSIQIAEGARQISTSSMELAQGAATQSSVVEELTSNINSITEQIQNNAKNANDTSKLALKAKESADIGNVDMKEMLVSMEEINNASESIAKIIKVIDDIAFQTNLLALNAAVEAARAGEHGKGFAVVAEEVRALAQRSKDAAAETNALIDESIEKASAGTVIANKTAKTLKMIVEQVNEISELIEGVAVSSEEQANAAERINMGIKDISRVTNSNSATSEEGAAAAQELSSQTEVFKELTGSFTLKNK